MATPAKPSPDDETYTGTPFSAPSPGSALEGSADAHDDVRTDVEVPSVAPDVEAQKAETATSAAPGPVVEEPPTEAQPAAPPPRPTPRPQAKAKPAAASKPPAAKAEARPAAASKPPARKPEPKPAAASRRSSTAGDGSDKAASSRRAAAVSSRRILTPEERAKRRKLILVIAGSVLGVILLAAGIIMLAGSGAGSDRRRAGEQVLLDAERQFGLAQNALASRRPEEARTAYAQALKLLTDSPELGHAAEMPAEDPALVKDLARRAWELRGRTEALKAPLAELEASAKAEANLAGLQTRLGTIGNPDTDIDVLERDIRAFMANPVDPKAGPDDTHAAAYARLGNQAKLRLSDVETERQRRLKDRSVTPVRQAELEINGLIQEERFGDALTLLDERARKHAGADFAPLKTTVEEAAAKAWKAAKSYADTRIADYRAAGSGEAMRRQALVGAKKRLNEVVERFGMPAYISQAKDMLAKLP